MITDYHKLQAVIDAGLELGKIRDIDALLEKTLELARRLVNADAGSIYIKDEDRQGRLKFKYTQNETLQQRGISDRVLSYKQFILPVNHESIAGYVAATGKIVNIPDVYDLPEDVSYSFNSEFDKRFEYHTKSMLVIPLKNPSLFHAKDKPDVNGVLQLINARNGDGDIIPFSEDDISQNQLFAHKAEGAIHQAQMVRGMILGVIGVAELRDPKETGPHVKRVGAVSAEIYETWARKKGIDPEEIAKFKDALRLNAMLHDVGKVAIEDAILKKPGKLNDEEYRRMKEHSFIGAQLMAKHVFSDYGVVATQIALNHHERWDGKGYPGHVDPLTGKVKEGYEDENGKAKGKKGEEIPIEGRIVAVADVYDALTHKRIYKPAWTEEDVLNEMKKSSGTHFDPEVVDAFFESYEAIQEIVKRFPDEEPG